MKLFFTLSIVLICFTNASAQQQTLYGMFWNNQTYYNPGAAGLFYDHSAFATLRQQNPDLKYALKSILANYSGRFDKIHGGAGVNYEYKSDSHSDIHRATVHYSFHLKTGENSVLGIGISGGIHDYQLQYDSPNVPARQVSGIGSFGLNWKRKELNIGLGLMDVIQIEKKFYETARYYVAHASHNFQLSEKFGLRPHLMISTDFVFSDLNASMQIYYANKYWIGASVRNFNSFGVMFGWDILEKMRLAYNYEISNIHIVQKNTTHEIVLGIMLGKN